ncbi:MAG: hypothetical protein ACRCZO_03440, partial [Cetobacterium sp.]
SQAVCGTQKAHRAVRLAIVKHMELHGVEYRNMLRCQYKSMEDYLSRSKMKYVGSWATEVEIQSTANYLGLDIFTYHNEKWLKYTCMHKRMCNQGIYLKHCNENHYEVVFCVKQPDNQICSKMWQNEKDDGKMCTRQSVKPQNKVDVKQDEPVYGGWNANNNLSFDMSRYSKNYYSLKRVKSKMNIKQLYHSNAEFQQHVKTVNRTRYHTNVLYNDSLKQASKMKYSENKQHQYKVKQHSKLKYSVNLQHKNKVKGYSKLKYSVNEQHKNKVKGYSKLKYSVNEQHKNKVKTYSRVKYHNNEKHRNTVQTASKLKYHNNALHKENVKRKNKMRTEQLKQNMKLSDFVRKQFEDKVSSGLDFVCCVCHRLLFKQQVLCCRKEYYNNNSAMSLVANRCITDKFLHK